MTHIARAVSILTSVMSPDPMTLTAVPPIMKGVYIR
jgi:hypothetical protein